MLYQAYQTHADLMWPPRTAATVALPALKEVRTGARLLAPVRKAAAAVELFALAQSHAPAPGLRHRIGPRSAAPDVAVQRGGRRTARRSRRCCTSARTSSAAQPRVLLVAPMSGHFATLLRDTVRTMLADHDVYITDWHNARDVPLGAGRFGLDEYIEHVIDFLEAIGPGAHLVAVCQPCVAALAAVAIMAEDGHPATPRSLTLMAGPIDCRISPTKVNELATSEADRMVRAQPDRHGARRATRARCGASIRASCSSPRS